MFSLVTDVPRLAFAPRRRTRERELSMSIVATTQVRKQLVVSECAVYRRERARGCEDQRTRDYYFLPMFSQHRRSTNPYVFRGSAAMFHSRGNRLST